MGKKIAVVLSGCGNQDGTEITEAVSLVIGLSMAGAEASFFAPSIDFSAKNFLTGQSTGEKRNILQESARISRGKIQDLSQLNCSDFEGLALPGGFGAALNLSTWATEGARCKVLPSLEKALLEFHAQSKPIAAICIAPAIVARVLGSKKITLTVGEESEASQEISKTGALHEICPVTDYITDRLNKIITTPAYMYDGARPHEVFKGISGLVSEFVEMC